MIFVFTGPTLTADEGRALLDATFLPPVAQGDVYRASREAPEAIGIIDGYFERVPAVWHKEILWAMSQGIHVFGSASMGALRAAELAPFGMVGVGAIYEAFQSGELEDDDEVALNHAPAEMDYRGLSEAMVNMRATLGAAARASVIGESTRDALVAIAKSLAYPERRYPRMLALATERELPAHELGALRDWLVTGRVDQKAVDARAMLAQMKGFLATEPGPKVVDYHFEHTDVWNRVTRRTGRHQREASFARDEEADPQALVDELRLAGESAYRGAMTGALSRALSAIEADRQGYRSEDAVVQRTADDFRRERGLLEVSDLARWLSEQRLDPDGFVQLMTEEARLRWIATVFAPEAARCLPAHLRTEGVYGRLAARSRHKQAVLAAHGLENLGLDDGPQRVSETELLKAYFEDLLHGEVPADVGAYARSLGFGGRTEFIKALLREYWFVQLRERDAAGGEQS